MKILLLDKTDEECRGSLKIAKYTRQELQEYLSKKHDLTTVLELEELTDALYATQDCVIFHAIQRKVERVLSLYERYPSTGLILTCGGFCNEDRVSYNLAQDNKGIFYLPTPYTSQILDSAIISAVNDARR